MELFKLNKEKLSTINSKPFKLEKDIQKVIEDNCDELFGLSFVKSEFAINGYRLDSLCFDHENNSFVIIEYKKGSSYSVVDQGYTYLSTMLNNKSDFVLEYNESTNSNLKRDEIDWSQSRVLFVSPSFTSYQKDSINFKDIPFELWQIKRFENGIIGLNQLISNSNESAKSIKGSNKKVLDEVEVYDEDSVLDRTSEEIKEIYFEIKERLSSWDDVSFKPARRYISIKKGKKVKVYLNFQSNRIKIHMFRRVDFKGQIERQKVKFNLDDPKKLFHMKSDNRREIYEYFMKDKKNFDYLISLFRQKYDS